MSPSLSWIDPAELKQTLSRVGINVEPDELPSMLRPVPLGTPLESELPAKAPAPMPAQLTFDRATSVAERVDRFARWLDELTSGAPAYLADAEGLVIFSRRMTDSAALASVALERALRPVRGLLGTQQVGSVVLELDGGQLVHTIWTTTAIGRAAIGVSVARPLGSAEVEQIRDAVRRVFQW